MSHPTNDQTTDKATADATSAFRADLLGDLDTPTDAAEAGVGEDGLPSGSLLLVVKRGPNAGSLFRLDQPVTSAGRHPDSGIFLDDVSVSRRHAEFRRETGEYLVVDTASLNGTYVNRKPVDSAALANGDEIQMGKFRLVSSAGPRRTDTHRLAPIDRKSQRAPNGRVGGRRHPRRLGRHQGRLQHAPDWTTGVVAGAGGCIDDYLGALLEPLLPERARRATLGPRHRHRGRLHCPGIKFIPNVP